MKFIGKNAELYSAGRLVDRVNSTTYGIGIVDASTSKKRVKVNGAMKKVQSPVYTRLMTTRYRAKKRDFEHDLTYEFVENFLTLPCVYCTMECTPQLDRKDNLKGYTMDNVVPACRRCNTVKSMYLTYDEMMLVAKTLGWRES